ncbi:MAG: response regulator [Proteobacteria bacterium]|nr:response regulator [Pseudomonadota bacterium]
MAVITPFISLRKIQAALSKLDIEVANSVANATRSPVATDQDERGDHPDVDYSRLKFLVVDDSRFCRTLIKNALAAYRIGNVLEADDAADAINTLQSVAIDFILVDYEMPGSDGVQFTRHIRWSEGGGIDPTVPIIMISGHTEASVILAAREAGIHEFIGKPVVPTALFKRIRATLEHPRQFIVAETYRGPDRRWIERD